MKGNNSQQGIAKTLARMTVVPILLLGIVIGIFGVFWISSSMEKEIKNELTAFSNTVYSSFDDLYIGDFSVSDDGKEITVTKGENELNNRYEFFDQMKERTDIDYTLFVGDLRVLTTLQTSEGTRLSGTYANKAVNSTVIEGGKSLFLRKVDILGSSYCAYYMPISNSDGSCVGAFAAVMSRKHVFALTFKAVYPIIVLILIAAIFAIFWSMHFSKEIRQTIKQLNSTFRKVSEGNLSNTVPPELLARKDEFGQMAHSIVSMQSSLRKLVEEDMLTGLVNRRSGQKRLEAQVEKYRDSKNSFCLALGDIDFFKKFNDTYGHDCGDLVLQHIAMLLQQQVKDYGVCSRWGGEEFLIIFSKGSLEECTNVMNGLIEAVRAHSVSYQDMELSVTMTFGLIDTAGLKDWDEMVKTVDNLLYEGKENGRNRLVVSGPILA